jgi:hypothetical protein
MGKYAKRDPVPLGQLGVIDQSFIEMVASHIPSTYTHPSSHSASMITETSERNFVTPEQKYDIHAPGSDNQDLSGLVRDNDPRLTDARTPLAHVHNYEPADVNIQTHVTAPHAPAEAQKNSDITKAEIEAKLTGPISSHSHAGGGGDLWTIIKLPLDFVTSLAANTNVPNFFFTPALNKTYLIFGYFLLRTATATVGARPGVVWPANLTDSIMRVEAANSLTTAAIRTWGARSTQNAASTGLATTADSHWGSLDGVMITSGTTSGNFQITLATETAGTNVIMKAGSILMYREL